MRGAHRPVRECWSGSYFNTLILLHFFVCICRGFTSETGGTLHLKNDKEKEREEHTEDRGNGRDKSGHGKTLTMRGYSIPGDRISISQDTERN